MKNLTFALFTLCALALTPSNQLSADTLTKVQQKKEIRWAADPSGGAPFAFYDPKDPDLVIGFEVDIMEVLSKELGVKPVLVKADWAAIIDELRTKRCDIVMNGMEITDDRKEQALFSEPYYRYTQQLTVRAKDREKYKDLATLKGRKIGTLNAAESNEVLKRAGFTEDQLLQHDDSLTPYTNLELGRVDAVLQESNIAAFYAGKNPKLYNIPETFSPGDYGIVVRSEDSALLAEVNRALKVIKENGELARIYTKWGLLDESQKEIGIR